MARRILEILANERCAVLAVGKEFRSADAAEWYRINVVEPAKARERERLNKEREAAAWRAAQQKVCAAAGVRFLPAKG